MKTRNVMQFKALIKQKAIEKKISPQLVMQNYMLERLLERIAVSTYRHQFILKGGFLIAAMIGLEARATMDLDTTLRQLTLDYLTIEAVFKEICKTTLEDDIRFEFIRVTDIREGDDYPGLRVSIIAKYDTLNVPLTVDITTGDVITPQAIQCQLPSLFDTRTIPVLAYPIETLLAEKVETVLSRTIANTRPRDFYDIHLLFRLYKSKCRAEVLQKALYRTMKKRGTLKILEHPFEILSEIRESVSLNRFWKRYQGSFDYAKGISFDETCNTLHDFLTFIQTE